MIILSKEKGRLLHEANKPAVKIKETSDKDLNVLPEAVDWNKSLSVITNTGAYFVREV